MFNHSVTNHSEITVTREEQWKCLSLQNGEGFRIRVVAYVWHHKMQGNRFESCTAPIAILSVRMATGHQLIKNPLL